MLLHIYLAYFYYNRGYAKIELKKYQEAIKDFNKTLELDPQFIDALYLRGATKSLSMQYEKSIKDYDEVIKLNPKNFYSLYW